MRPTAKIMIIALATTLGLVLVALAALVSLHSGAWPPIEQRLHPDINKRLATLEQHIDTVQQRLQQQTSPVKPQQSSTSAHFRKRLLETQHYILQAQEYAQFKQKKQMVLALRLAKQNLKPLQNKPDIQRIKSLLDQKLVQLGTPSNPPRHVILDQLTQLIEQLTTITRASSPTINTAKAPSFWQQPADFITHRLAQAVQIQQQTANHNESIPVAAIQALSIAKNAVLQQDSDTYRLALANTKQLLHATAHHQAATEVLQQLPTELPHPALPKIEGLVQLLHHTLQSTQR